MRCTCRPESGSFCGDVGSMDRHRGTSPWLAAATLAAAALLHGALTAAWVITDPSLMSGTDAELHHIYAMFYARVVALGSAGELWDVFRKTHEIWPPVTYIVHGLASVVTLMSLTFWLDVQPTSASVVQRKAMRIRASNIGCLLGLLINEGASI